MVIHSLQRFVILLLIYHALGVVECSDDELLDPLLSESSIHTKGNLQENVDIAQANILDIHLAMQPVSNSLNLRKIIYNDIKTLLKSECKAPAMENTENEKPLAERSINDKLEKYLVGLEKNVNYLVDEIKAINKRLNTSEEILNKASSNMRTCLKEDKSLGVFYNTDTEIKQNFTVYPKNCKEIKESGHNVTGIYKIYPTYSKKPFAVLCDMDIRDGGWTHIQKRFDGSQDFYLGWREYKFGFGNLEGEFWLGLQNIHLLTNFEETELLVEIVDRDNVTAYAYYNTFAIGPESSGYTLKRISGFSGDAGDSLIYHLGMKFSTKDLDFSSINCSTTYLGAWWYESCYKSNLNGKYINIDLPEKFKYMGMNWNTFRDNEYSHSKSRMLIRPSN